MHRIPLRRLAGIAATALLVPFAAGACWSDINTAEDQDEGTPDQYEGAATGSPVVVPPTEGVPPGVAPAQPGYQPAVTGDSALARPDSAVAPVAPPPAR